MNALTRRTNELARSWLAPAEGVEGEADPSREIRLGLIIAGLFFIVFLGWAAFAPLDAGAYASGEVVVSGSRQAVQHREGGVVSALRVSDGAEVARGQVLVEISADEVGAIERALTAEVIALEAQRARLQAERDKLPNLIVPASFAQLPPEDQVIAAQSLRLEREQLAARRGAFASRRGVLGQRVGQLTQQIEGSNRQLSANREQQALIEEELKGVKELAARGYAPQTRVRALERQAADLRGTNGAYRSQAAQAQEAIGQTRMEMITLERGMTEEVIEQLRQTEVQLGALQPKLMAAREQLGRSLIRAPAAGKVVGLSVHTVGGVVQPGQTLMEIVPRNADLIVRARVSPDDADDLSVGQETEIRISAFHERNLPLLQGRITAVSADSFIEEKTSARFFTIDVVVPPREVAKILKARGADAGLRPGLPVEVVVPLRKRTALQYFFEPLQQSVWRSFREH